MSAMSNDCELDFLMMGNLDLSKSLETQLKAVIDRLPNYRLPNSYDEIEDSQFKRDFLQNINGKLEDHIPSLRCMDNPCFDNELFDDLQSKHQKPSFKQMLAIRSSLPVFKMRSTIILMVQSSQVMLISGETGCGKTTQVPQFILDYFISTRKGSSCKIMCTQPRRISAISVAKRVAAERGEILGQSTGYKIRLEEEYPRDRASITFCTTGVILRKMQSDPFLTEYSHIILDEIHERGIEADFLITLLKQVMRKRKDLRIILMSATLNAKSFWSYFGNCPHLNINSNTYSVEKYFLEDVIEKIKFEFLPASKVELEGPAAEKQKEFDSIIKPYIEELQTNNKYDEQVYKQISNINSEELNILLIFNLLEYICFKVRTTWNML
ncbi:hypothetical protein WA026_000345 [Henosepilachna vigintioctopunctata]|uniref:RNA helicase n=1 Tax=Henosepilachna vigintioctopunctata TaxID=420089 RepID=A0AAW1V064_9CUCU